MKNLMVVLVLSSLLLALSGPVFGDVMTYNGMGLNEVVTIHDPGTLANNLSVYAGQNLLEYDGTDYTGYCVDLNHYSGTASATEVSVTTLTRGQQVAYLFNTYGPVATTDRQAAALAVAIWELVGETGTNLDASSGSFYITGNSQAASDANALLATVPATYNSSNMPVVLQCTNAQSFVIGGGVSGPVPEPSVLLLTILGGVAQIWRKRRQRASV